MTARELTSTKQVVDELGGLSAVAALTGSKYKTVWMWQSSGAFPAKTFLVLTAELRKRGKSAPASLWGMTTQEQAAS